VPIYLPLISRQFNPTPPPFTPAEKVLFCSAGSHAIPDNNENGQRHYHHRRTVWEWWMSMLCSISHIPG
jgi:hypothetical protein